ncbi:scaffolding protein [Clostridium perfringens]|uniref:phage scaffolding protein n=1 Tax=Clostridium perfringens TaxID=1502 RepID=UPI000DA26B44|nr:phage scaffolding protein [Clostridium perfringens]KAF2783025.1 scaffolding protein [Clostridium perfringens]SQI03837.1 scaffold protein [Clostridium perfringens]HBI6897917.1 phage scaffolding protein [Clostridium perfringens]HBI6918542.1 phage scaffolding protein [Clostridium perfringens]HBI7038618.1 phage scaffolding protein [Clostridium perfringens]
MEWLRKLLEGAVIEDGKLDINGLMKLINTEFPKNAVPKEKYNEVSNDLKTANKTLDNLRKNHKDVEDLQKEIEGYKTKMSDLEATRAKEQKEFTIKSKLKDLGCTDLDYMLYKLGDIDKLDLEKDWENKAKELKENNATFFPVEENKGDEPKNNLNVLENKLNEVNNPNSFTMEQLRNMTPEEINKNWDTIKDLKLE